MTVEVDTPQGLASGSSVYEVTARKSFRLTSEESAGGGGLRGEAVQVDLPNGPIFVLLRLPDGRGSLASVATETLSGDKRLARSIDDYIAAVRTLGSWFGDAEAELSREEWPIMVRFRDLGDPSSVEQVDAGAINVRRIHLVTTSESVRTGIERRLPWLTAGGLTLDPAGGPTTTPTFAQTIRQRDFSTQLER